MEFIKQVINNRKLILRLGKMILKIDLQVQALEVFGDFYNHLYL